ncbi:MAG: dihydropteroate synthase [Myxococcales bacterium]|nr:dihydropteroate synthase [Myxococcales bacterium]
MILARPICAERAAELELAFSRLGLPGSERQRLTDKLAHYQLMLTGLSPVDALFLKACSENQSAPGREDFPSYVPGEPEARGGSAVLAGRREQVVALVAAARAEHLPELAVGIERALLATAVPSPLTIGRTRLVFGERTYLMGVVNVTPDSFSDGGRFLEAPAAIEHGIALARAGADILDVGGESTRPGARKVSADEELSRVLPVIRGLRDRLPEVPISVDTYKARVAREALAAGASMVNDISGFHFDPELPPVVAEAKAACCLMHVRGTPESMQEDPRYEDVVAEVIEYLQEGIARADAAGVELSRLVVDPGIGFGKTVGHNLFLLRRLMDLRVLGRPVLVGTSRKSFLGHLTGGKPPGGRLPATLASVASVAVAFGADIVRVHDVAEAKDALALADALRSAKEGGTLFAPPA